MSLIRSSIFLKYLMNYMFFLPKLNADLCVFTCVLASPYTGPTHVKTHKLLQICSQAVDKLSSHCLFPVVVTSLEQAVSNL